MMIARCLLLMICVVVIWPTHAAPEDSIVGLYINRGSGRADLGTGFFTSDSGQIMTAYHVVAGANKIQVVDANKQIYSKITVAYVSPQHDLAFLQIASPQVTTPFLKIDDFVPQPGVSLSVIGYPRGLSRQHITVRTTSPNFISSKEIRSRNGARLFQEEIDVIGLDGTSYSGMSGAPVIANGVVVGVFSGSFNEGGGIAWAIPVKYVEQVTRLGNDADKIQNWPSFTLMNSSFRSLQRAYRVNEIGEQRLTAYLDSVDRHSRAINELTSSATQLKAAFQVMRPMFQGARNNPQLINNRDALNEYIEFPMELTMEKMDAFGKANTEFGHANQFLATALLDLIGWYEQDPGITQQERYVLDQRANQIEHLPGNYYADIGFNQDNFIQAVTQFGMSVAQMGEGASGRRKFIDAMLQLEMDTAPEVEKHTTVRAITKARKDSNAYSVFASLFESVVYR